MFKVGDASRLSELKHMTYTGSFFLKRFQEIEAKNKTQSEINFKEKNVLSCSKIDNSFVNNHNSLVKLINNYFNL